MSRKEGIIAPEKIHLFRIKVFQSNLETSEAFLEAPEEIEGFEFEIRHEVAHNFDESLARYRLFFALIAIDDEKAELGLRAEYGIEFHFKVDNFNDFLYNKKGDVIIDANLGTTLMAIAYSTARGIVLERMQGTYFEGAILPIIDPHQVLMQKLDAPRGEMH